MTLPAASVNIVVAIQRLRDAHTTYEQDVNDADRYTSPGPAGKVARAKSIDQAKARYDQGIVTLESDPGWRPWCTYCARNGLSERAPAAMSGALTLAIYTYSGPKPPLDLTLAEVMEVVEKALSSEPPMGLSPCEKDCIEAVRKAGKRLPRASIISNLDGKHGESTIKNALASLTQKMHLLTNGKGQRAKGYGLREWGDGDGPAAAGIV
jgi:hypothetical protein